MANYTIFTNGKTVIPCGLQSEYFYSQGDENMISVQNNLLAIGANTQIQINGKKTGKTMEKLSSGYRINRAADDAAGLAISEKMRRQIRGLKQGTANAQDGISFVQVADGAMNEVHDILQRMNELTVKSLNGTCTEGDRAALDAEFDQLRSEIDRIDYGTFYNEQPVFEEHEDSFYRIAGNRKWDDNQMHTVPAMGNEMNIHLPSYYTPNKFTFTVPPGTYTTQELVDEIDDALGRMSPRNPGFVFELTKDGYCNINFERPNGMPAEISTVDGSLSYLIYDYYNGSATTSLLGTTMFDLTEPLIITSGQNDELGFYVEKSNNTNFVSLKIPAGAYSRSQMIDLINNQLAGNPNASGVKAMEYGDSCIQIKGEDNATSITGLKGNMFKLETAKPVYSSVFYDNVNYGNSTGGTHASIQGSAYYGSGYTTKVAIDNTNNILRLKINGAANFTEITLDPGKEYTISELASEINKKLKDKGLENEIGATTYYSSPYYYLALTSKIGGKESRIEFDTTANTVYANTYDALFLSTRYLPSRTNGWDAVLTGAANLNGEINLDANAALSFNINGKQYTIDSTVLAGKHTDGSALAAKINAYIKTAVGFIGIADKIEFGFSSGHLNIKGLTKDVQSIAFDARQKNDTYKKLFTGTVTNIRYVSFSEKSGSIDRPQGSTQVNKVDASSSVVIPADRRNIPITIDGAKNKIGFLMRGYNKEITLRSNTYSNMASLVAEMNYQFRNSGDAYLQSISASYDGATGKLTFTSTPPSSVADGTWYIQPSYYYSNSNSAWWGMLGTTTDPVEHSSQTSRKATLTTYLPVPANVAIDGNNDKLTLNIGNSDGDVEITIPKGNYTGSTLKDALQASIDQSVLKGKVTVGLTSDGKLQMTADSNSITSSGSFHMDILLSRTKAKDVQSYTKEGDYKDSDYTDAYIIGRKDLKAEPIEIFSGANDVFTFDFTHKSRNGTANSYKKEMNITIPEGVYTGDEIAALLQQKIQDEFAAEGLDDFDIKVTVGGLSTGVVGANDDTALQIVVKRKADKAPDAGSYVLDGIRGSAASFVFYKTNGKPKETYIVGTKDISKGITFKEGQNVFTFSADSVPYQYTFPENSSYTGQEFVDMLNDMFANGDDNGNKAPLTATLENGALKIAHKAVGTHTLTDIGGSARVAMFLEESERRWRDPLNVLVGAETRDLVEIPRTRINSCSLAINSVTISKPKYAEKALRRVKEAIGMVSGRRSTYGSMQNRLEHTVDNNNNVIENTQASESLIRDADMASEMMAHAKNSIMMQASQAMLVQANKSADVVMNLLR